jgi:nicotinamide mononucleotide transporter
MPFDTITLLEFLGTAFALTGVYLTARENIWCWLFGIAGIIIYTYIFFQSKLYGDAALQAVYFFLSIYGWYQWKFGSVKNETLTITLNTFRQIIFFIAIGFAGGMFFGWLLNNYTDSDVPYWDGLTTSYSLVATYMMARKYLYHWIFWIIIDVVYTGIYTYKNLYITVFQYAVFCILAVLGYLQWRQKIEAKKLLF